MLSPVAPSRRAGRTPVWRMPTIRPEWTRTRSWPVRERLLVNPNEVHPATSPRPDGWPPTSFDHTSPPQKRSPSELLSTRRAGTAQTSCQPSMFTSEQKEQQWRPGSSGKKKRRSRGENRDQEIQSCREGKEETGERSKTGAER